MALLGNHLIANAKGLIFGTFFSNKKEIYQKMVKFTYNQLRRAI